LGAIYMLTRRLWAAIGLHMAWNFTQGGIFGVAVSGFETSGLLKPVMEGPDLLTGGAFGAEASLPAICLCTATGFYFLYRAYRSGRFVFPSWHRFKTGEEQPLIGSVGSLH
ncbi:MAG: CPBP family intramembrane glutamic endopeptidase, partial [Sphingorhabdus sp.]